MSAWSGRGKMVCRVRGAGVGHYGSFWDELWGVLDAQWMSNEGGSTPKRSPLEVVEIWGKWREHKGASSIFVVGCFK